MQKDSVCTVRALAPHRRATGGFCHVAGDLGHQARCSAASFKPAHFAKHRRCLAQYVCQSALSLVEAARTTRKCPHEHVRTEGWRQALHEVIKQQLDILVSHGSCRSEDGKRHAWRERHELRKQLAEHLVLPAEAELTRALREELPKAARSGLLHETLHELEPLRADCHPLLARVELCNREAI